MMEKQMNSKQESATDILPLAEAAGLRVGESVNTMLFNEGGWAAIHLLTDVSVRKEYGAHWLVVRWAAGGQTPWGTNDCGFAGWRVDEALRERLRELSGDKAAAGAPA